MRRFHGQLCVEQNFFGSKQSAIRRSCMLALIFRTFCLISLLAGATAADDWPGFRGSTGDGISTEKDPPVVWSANEGIRWRTRLQGRGNSSPVVVAGRVYLTSRRKDDSLWLHAFETKDGSVAWEKNVTVGKLSAKAPFGLYGSDHDAATPTAVANDSLVCALFGTGDLVCFDRDGRLLWRRNLMADYGELDINFGIGASPRLWRETIYLSCLSKGPTYVIAIDVRNGKNRWKVERDFPAREDGEDSYATPAIWELDGNVRLLVAGADRLNAYALASGRQLWVAGGFGINAKTGRIIASPAFSGEVVLQCTGNPQGNGRAIALRVNGKAKDDITDSHRIWRFERRTPDRPSPMCYEGNAYLVRDSGMTYCLDLESGKQLWTERLAAGKYYASIIAADGKLYFQNVRGTTTVLQAGGEFRKLAENTVKGRAFNATPAISDGVIYLRSYDALIAIDGSRQ